MRRSIVWLVFCAIIYASCNSGNGNKATDETSKDNTNSTATTGSENNDAGLEMIAALDCTTCHKINEKLIGPAYADVAKKYGPNASEATIDSLAHKVITGGQGVWGQIPMTPHPGLSMDSAKIMVKYILSLPTK